MSVTCPLPAVRAAASFFTLAIFSAVFFVATLGAPPAAAVDMTGFLPSAGEGTIALSYTDESYDEFWAGTHKTSAPPLGEISTQSASLWLSWGLTGRLALLANVAGVDTQASGPAAFEDSGPQDASILVASRVWRAEKRGLEHSLVVAGGVRTALDSYVANAPVSRGDQSTDVLVRLVYLLHGERFYWSQQVGFNLRSGETPNDFPIYTELGWPVGRFTWIACYTRLFADGGTDIGDPGFTFPSNREEYERVGAKLVADVNNRWALFAGVFTTLDGRNAGDTDSLSLGVIRHF